MQDRPAEASEVPAAFALDGRARGLPTTSLSAPQNPTSQNRKQPIGPLELLLRPTLLELPIQLSKNRQTWATHRMTLDCTPVDPSEDIILGCTSSIFLLLQRQ